MNMVYSLSYEMPSRSLDTLYISMIVYMQLLVHAQWTCNILQLTSPVLTFKNKFYHVFSFSLALVRTRVPP